MEMEQIYYPDQSQQLTPPPTHILDGLSSFPGTSPYSTPTEYVERFQEFVMHYPNMPHLLGGIGEPLSGKLSVVAEILDLLTYPGGSLRQFARDNGFRIQKYLLTWGEPFDVIESKDLPDDMSWRNKSRIQTPEAVPIFFDSLARTIAGYERPKRGNVIRLIGYDAVPHTGYRFEGDGEYGLIRANNEMQQLALHEGPFQGLTYSDWRFGIAAESALRADNKQFRAAVLGARNIGEMGRILEIWNKKLVLGEEMSLASYGRDEASIANTEEIEREMEELTWGLSRHRLIDLSDFGGIDSADDLSYPHGRLAGSRDRIIGGIVNPRMFALTNANFHMSAHFFNSRKKPETVLNLKGYRRPVREIYYPK